MCFLLVYFLWKQSIVIFLCLYSGAVLSLTMSEDGESCYSGGLDGSVRCWKIPDLNVDPYDNYGETSQSTQKWIHTFQHNKGVP